MGFFVGLVLLALIHLEPSQSVIMTRSSFGGVVKHFPRPEFLPTPVCTAETVSIEQHCIKDLQGLTIYGFPWCKSYPTHHDSHAYAGGRHRNILGDPLDCMNEACDIFDKFQNCLIQHAVPEVCLADSSETIALHTDFNFLCKTKKRSVDLIHVLRCLQESRVLDLLIFHLVDRHGASFADPYVQGNRNAFFRFINAESISVSGMDPHVVEIFLSRGMICFPQEIFLRKMSAIINEACGVHAARLMIDYFIYFRETFDSLLKQLGLHLSVCDTDHEVIPEIFNRPETADDHPDSQHWRVNTEFDQFLDQYSEGTALDTLYGHAMRHYIKNIPTSGFCDPNALLVPFGACFLLQHDQSERGIFNVIYFAHGTVDPFLDYPQQSSLERFRACRNLLVQMCGANATFYDYVVDAVSGTSDIDIMMENITCQWQDTLIKHYIRTSGAGSLWPTVFSLARRPLFLKPLVYSYGRLMQVSADLRDHLSGGISELTVRCGRKAGARLERFYETLSYAWYNFLKLQDILQRS